MKYYTRWSMYVYHSLKIDSFQKLKENAFAYDLDKKRLQIYYTVDLMGYSPMALPEYEQWLQTYHKHKIKPITP